MAKVNYEVHADALADALQEFVYIHSGSDNGIGLQLAFNEALRVLMEYRKAFEQANDESLKQKLSNAYWDATELEQDPWQVVLLELAKHTARWEKYSSDDRTVTEDLAAWFRAEAAAETTY